MIKQAVRSEKFGEHSIVLASGAKHNRGHVMDPDDQEDDDASARRGPNLGRRHLTNHLG
jgi:hypothetical protein